ncbi:hypothetical protein B7494_g6471 [Chlorociboria aeruginascens]|nr:hypothetical protein B7494_g6471 [Chlorociboria aeruginascens]
MSFPNLPAFPLDIPTAPLHRISLRDLHTSPEESTRFFKSCVDLGFFYLDLRDDPEGEILLQEADKLFTLAPGLFDLGTEELQKYDYREQGSYMGYKGFGNAVVDEKGNLDRNEFYNIPKDDFLGISKKPFAHPRILYDHDALIQSYMCNSHALVTLLLTHLNTHLQLPPSTLTSLHRLSAVSGDQVRMVKSPPQPPSDMRTALGKHTDFGSLTVLFNRLGGLQILPPPSLSPNSTPEWTYVKPLPGHCIINLGDAMTKFSNGLLRSNIHRVVSPPGEQAKETRYSLVYFSRPEEEVVLRRLDSAVIPEPKEAVKEDEMKSKDWIKLQAMRMRSRFDDQYFVIIGDYSQLPKYLTRGGAVFFLAAPLRQLKTPLRRRKKPQRRHKAPKKSEETHLLRNPAPKAASPYSPKSDFEDRHLRFLIHHCKVFKFDENRHANGSVVTFVTAKTVVSAGPRFEWYPLAVRDEAFFHAVISITSAHVTRLLDRQLHRSYYFHRGEAIKLVNDRLAEGAHDEGTINTIVVFGLQEVVACIGSMAKPMLPGILTGEPEEYFGPPSIATVEYAKTFGTRLFNFTGSQLSEAAAKVFWGLRNITLILESIHSGEVSPDTESPYDLQFTDRVEVLERLVHSLWYADEENVPHVLFRSFGWTCLIYIYAILRELPSGTKMIEMIAGKVRSSLDSCSDLNVLLATFPDLLLWQMFLCGNVARSEDREFFAKQASKILLMRKIEDEESILGTVEQFLWPDRLAPAFLSRQMTMPRFEAGDEYTDNYQLAVAKSDPIIQSPNSLYRIRVSELPRRGYFQSHFQGGVLLDIHTTKAISGLVTPTSPRNLKSAPSPQTWHVLKLSEESREISGLRDLDAAIRTGIIVVDNVFDVRRQDRRTAMGLCGNGGVFIEGSEVLMLRVTKRCMGL